MAENIPAHEKLGSNWTPENSATARAEGWDVYLLNGDPTKLDIQRCDDLDVFAHDEVAVDHVQAKAAGDSPLHQKAFALHSSWEDIPSVNLGN